MMGLTRKEGPATEAGDGRVATVTTSPKPPPPKAPTYGRGPSSRSQNLLGGIAKEIPKGRIRQQVPKGGFARRFRRKGFQMRSHRKGFQRE